MTLAVDNRRLAELLRGDGRRRRRVCVGGEDVQPVTVHRRGVIARRVKTARDGADTSVTVMVRVLETVVAPLLSVALATRA